LRILVTNDDGINAPGLWKVAESLQALGDVVVVAPDRDQSGVGTSRTLLQVLRVIEVESRIEGVPARSVHGTPADCVILAMETLFPEPFDLLVSGINPGANLGLDVLDSGTVGGAFRGYFRGIPSIAVSVTSLSNVRYDLAARVTAELAKAISDHKLSQPMIFNVNVPNIATDQIDKVEMTTLGPKAYLESVVEGKDGRRVHYWIHHNKPIGDHAEEGTDIWAVRHNRISITPMDPTFISGHGGQDFGPVAQQLSNRLGTNGHQTNGHH
jgi:5'-nucleotidase